MAGVEVDPFSSDALLGSTGGIEEKGSIEKQIVCVDCGGRCHLLSYAPEEGFAPGDIVAYRCEDCLDRWDLVVEAPEDDAPGRGEA